MAADPDCDVGGAIFDLVRTVMSENAIVAPLRPDARLADIGLTSMDMVNLMLAVEAEFDMMIPQADITPENFQSVDAMERLVRRLRRTERGDRMEERAGEPAGGTV
jgi:acyl carrier protein